VVAPGAADRAVPEAAAAKAVPHAEPSMSEQTLIKKVKSPATVTGEQTHLIYWPKLPKCVFACCCVYACLLSARLVCARFLQACVVPASSCMDWVCTACLQDCN
jgi:hypothetical protein